MAKKKRATFPGFGLSMGLSVTYLSLVVLIPLSFLFLQALTLSFSDIWGIVTSPRVLAAYKLSFGAAGIAAFVNVILGLLLAWTLVRYQFWGRKLLDSLIDLPFALPTAVAGIALTTLYSSEGWLGKGLEVIGIKVAFTPLGIVFALIFIGFPFVVRTLQPVIEEVDKEIEEAAQTLGATKIKTFTYVIFPQLIPALLTGFTLAFARALGEYGSVVFISGNMPMKTEIAPLLIMTKLEQFDYAGATAIAAVMLIFSFLILLLINVFQAKTNRGLQ